MNGYILAVILIIAGLFIHSPYEKLDLTGQIPLAVKHNSYYETFREIDSWSGSYHGTSGDYLDEILAGNDGHFFRDILFNGTQALFPGEKRLAKLGEGEIDFTGKKYHVLAWLSRKDDKVFIQVADPQTNTPIAAIVQHHLKKDFLDSDFQTKGYALLEFKNPETAKTIMIYASYMYREETKWVHKTKKDPGHAETIGAFFSGKLAAGSPQILVQTVKIKKNKVKIAVYDENLDFHFSEADSNHDSSQKGKSGHFAAWKSGLSG